MQLLWIAIAVTLPLAAQKGVGEQYGTRDPRTCRSPKTPGNAAPSQAVVLEAVACAREGVSSNYLFLVENLKVEVAAKGRRYSPNIDSASSIDVDVPVYAVRGSFNKYLCVPIVQSLSNAGKNCTIFAQPNATGTCYKTTFGDWKCSLGDDSASEQRMKQPPPPKN